MSITESDVKQKFDEWFEREYKHLESSKYTDAVPHIKYGFWMAYRAAVAEFLGKSENFMNIISELQGSLVVSDFKEACKYGKEIKELKSRNDTLVEALEKAQQRIAELESRTVTVKLPKPHAHLIWIQAGHAPDDYWDDVAVSHSEKDRCCDGSERYPVYARWEIEEMLAAAGIKVEDE
ncbi:TPA: hypothetical protein ACTW9J_000096 [Klebsiella michiganensis]